MNSVSDDKPALAEEGISKIT